MTARMDKRRTAAGVAIHLGQDHAGDAQALVELVGRFDGVLAGHGVGDEQDFDRVELFLELAELGHQLFVDVQAAGRVDEDYVATGLDGFPYARSAPGRAGLVSPGAPS